MEGREPYVQYPRETADTENVRRRRAITLFSLAALLLASPLAEAREPRPYVTSVSPLSVSVGELMTIKGFYFTPGYAENVVVFVARDGRVSYVRSEHSTKRSLQVRIPKKVERILRVVDGVRVPTKFRVKVISTRMSRLAKGALSQPLIGPDVGGDCDNDGTPNPSDTDDDNDMLPDTLEATAKTNPCSGDSDGDKLMDGWEFLSALDLNRNNLPYPGKRPYPNALFADAQYDFDGDGLHSWAEHAMWWTAGRHYPLNYSDGDQHTIRETSTEHPWDLLHPLGLLSDDERDFDNDGISNILEYAAMAMEPWKDYPGIDRPNWMDPDTDGDGLLDGPDDQDHDDISNAEELDAGTWAMNPCDPLNLDARACPRWMEIGTKPEKPEELCTSITLALGGGIRWYSVEDDPPPAEWDDKEKGDTCDGPISFSERTDAPWRTDPASIFPPPPPPA